MSEVVKNNTRCENGRSMSMLLQCHVNNDTHFECDVIEDHGGET